MFEWLKNKFSIVTFEQDELAWKLSDIITEEMIKDPDITNYMLAKKILQALRDLK